MPETEELRHETKTIPLPAGVDQVDIHLAMGIGKLYVQAGSEALLDAEFTYNVAAWQPQISLEHRDATAYLTVRQPRAHTTVGRRAENTWRIRLAGDVPMDLHVKSGVGNAELNLAKLPLRRLSTKLGVGEATLMLTDNPQLGSVHIDMGVGNLTVDLRGEWQHDVTADIHGGTGTLTLQLPTEIGVKVVASKGIGRLRCNGLHHQGGGVWVNPAYTETGTTLNVTIHAGVGQINLNVGG